MKKYGMTIKYYGEDGKVKERLIQSGNRITLNLLSFKVATGRQVISIETRNQETGELLERVNMADIKADIERQIKEAGFVPPSEDDHLLLMASTKDEELLAVAKISMRKYRETGGIEYLAAVTCSYGEIKRRGLKNQEIEAFVRKNSFEKNIRKLALKEGFKGDPFDPKRMKESK